MSTAIEQVVHYEGPGWYAGSARNPTGHDEYFETVRLWEQDDPRERDAEARSRGLGTPFYLGSQAEADGTQGTSTKPFVAITSHGDRVPGKARWYRIADGYSEQEAEQAALQFIGRGTIVEDTMRRNLRIVPPTEADRLCGPELGEAS